MVHEHLDGDHLTLCKCKKHRTSTTTISPHWVSCFARTSSTTLSQNSTPTTDNHHLDHLLIAAICEVVHDHTTISKKSAVQQYLQYHFLNHSTRFTLESLGNTTLST